MSVENQTGQLNKQPRNVQLELLRCLAMMMVVVLHFLGKGGLLDAGVPAPVRWCAWVLEAFAICAVNVYMLLSGYFLSESSFKLSRLLRLLLQVWTYSVVIGFAGIALNLIPVGEKVDTYFLLKLLFPISQEHYWFLTAYVYLYLLLPLVGGAVRRLDRKAFRTLLGLLLTVFCFLKSFLPLRFDMDRKGYDCLWYLCVFLIAAYIRRFGIPFFKNSARCAAVYLLSVAAIAASGIALAIFIEKTGRLSLLYMVMFEYNHILPLLASLGLFCLFLNRKPCSGGLAKLACFLGPNTLGVYLLHENAAIRYAWPVWLGAKSVSNVGRLFLMLPIAVLAVFAAGILVEWLRGKLMEALHRGLMHVGAYRKIVLAIRSADGFFAQKE